MRIEEWDSLSVGVGKKSYESTGDNALKEAVAVDAHRERERVDISS